ncbi:MAG: DUF4431 domain-containing protein [Bdellovibrionia bacterium]
MKSFPFLLILFACPSLASNQVLTYGPSIVELTGTLDLQTFPGPPNYESIKNGDEIERHFYLKLDKAVDVLPKGASSEIENPEKERNVRIIQLSISEEDDKLWDSFRKVGKGAHVKIQGTLFHRFTGHHHSRILMVVSNMQPK